MGPDATEAADFAVAGSVVEDAGGEEGIMVEEMLAAIIWKMAPWVAVAVMTEIPRRMKPIWLMEM